MQKIKILSVVVFAVFQAGCGGGGGGGSGGSPSNASVSCVNSQTTGCTFNTSDPQQSALGWWKGTRTVSTGQATAHLIVDAVNNIKIYLGDDFSGGYLTGSISVLGS